MANLSKDYIELLHELRGAPLRQVLYQHQLFWLKRASELKHDFSQACFSAYHLGIIPSRISSSLQNNWFLDPQVSLQRIGLYADVIVFDDIVGHILAKLPHMPKEYKNMVSDQVQVAISQLLALGDWVKMDIVRILPNDKTLKKVYQDGSFQILDAVSSAEACGDLPDIIKDMLSREQRAALAIGAGHALNYKMNKALLLKEQLDFVPSADDTYYDIFCEKLKWNHRVLGEVSNLYLLKKIRPKYFATSSDLVFELRKQNQLSSVRRFLREQINSFFGEDIKSRSHQESIDEFSRALADQIDEADAELDGLKRKLGSEVIINLALGGASMLLALGVDFGANFASWIPKIVGSLPAAHAGKNILEAIKSYIIERTEVKTKPTFILGSQEEKT